MRRRLAQRYSRPPLPVAFELNARSTGCPQVGRAEVLAGPIESCCFAICPAGHGRQATGKRQKSEAASCRCLGEAVPRERLSRDNHLEALTYSTRNLSSGDKSARRTRAALWALVTLENSRDRNSRPQSYANSGTRRWKNKLRLVRSPSNAKWKTNWLQES